MGCFQFSTSRTVLLKMFSLSVQTFTHLHLVCPWAWKTHGYSRSLSARCQTALRSGGTNSHCRRPSSLPLGIVHLVRVRPPAERVARPPCNLIPYLSAKCHVPWPRFGSLACASILLCFYSRRSRGRHSVLILNASPVLVLCVAKLLVTSVATT